MYSLNSISMFLLAYSPRVHLAVSACRSAFATYLATRFFKPYECMQFYKGTFLFKCQEGMFFRRKCSYSAKFAELQVESFDESTACMPLSFAKLRWSLNLSNSLCIVKSLGSFSATHYDIATIPLSNFFCFG